MFEGGVAESQEAGRPLSRSRRPDGCGFFDAGTVARTTPLDGVHLDAENTRAIGTALAPLVRQMLGL